MKTLNLTIAALFAFAINAKSQIITTIAGGFTGNGATAKAIGYNPGNIVFDKAGNMYIACPERHNVLKLSVAGVYSVYAGTGISGFSGDGGLATAAQLRNPYNLAIDAQGNLYIADSYDNRVRKVAVNGIITTLAGNGTAGFSGDGGPAKAAALNGVNGVAADAKGNVYAVDFENRCVRKINLAGIITRFAGTGDFGYTGDGGPADQAKLGQPIGIAADSIGEVFITDLGYNNVRKVDTNGIITRIAGPKFGGNSYTGDGGPALSATFNTLVGIAFDAAGNIYVADQANERVRKIGKDGIVTTVAGNGTRASGGDGSAATSASLNLPMNVQVDAAGNLYITETNRVRKVDASGTISTCAGNGTGGFNGSPVQALAAQLYSPGVALPDGKGNIIIADRVALWKLTPGGVLTVIAGMGKNSPGDGGPAIDATFSSVTGLAIDTAGEIFIADFFRIRKIDKNGVITTVAGNGTNGFSGDGGPATSAAISYPCNIALNKNGELIISDGSNNRIRKVDAGGIISTIAGTGVAGFDGDGGQAINAEFNFPFSIAADADGNIFVADQNNNRVRKIAANGIINTVAGTGSNTFNGGDGGSALLANLQPNAIAVDGSGNLLIGDAANLLLRQVDAKGIITTLAGGGTSYGDGGLATKAQLGSMGSLAINGNGSLIITDYTNHRVRQITGLLLPLKLLTFNAIQNNNKVLVDWKTSNEINVDRYDVERSETATTFIKVGVVPAGGLADYTFADTTVAQLKAKTVYYRLQMVDKDGKYTYSNTVPVAFKFGAPLFSVYPNPAQKIINISGDGIKYISILTTDGKTVIKQAAPNYNTSINISSLSKGMYIVKTYNNDGSTQTQKLLVQ